MSLLQWQNLQEWMALRAKLDEISKSDKDSTQTLLFDDEDMRYPQMERPNMS